MQKSLLHTKESIILASIEIINKYGIQGWSTKKIAKEAGITEGAIFRHFKTKNEILLELLNHYAKYDRSAFETVRLKSLNPIDSLYFLSEFYAQYYESYPAITAIINNYEAFHSDKNFKRQIEEIFEKRTAFIYKLLSEARDAGMIKDDVDLSNLTSVLIGTFREICLQWRFSGCNFSLKERIMSSVKMLMKAFSS